MDTEANVSNPSRLRYFIVAVASLAAFALLRFPTAVAREWRHPVKMSFGATITVSLLLLGGTPATLTGKPRAAG